MVLGVGFEPTMCLCHGFTVRLLRPLAYPSTGGYEESCTLSFDGFRPSASAIAPRSHKENLVVLLRRSSLPFL